MLKKCYHLFFGSLLAIYFMGFGQFKHETVEHYQQGVTQMEQGRWQAALKTWLTAKDSLDKIERSDPRIGLAFIKLVTEKQATDYYEQASEMYFWGFSHFQFGRYQEAVKKELQRISPLLSKEDRKRWFNLFDKQDPEMVNLIKGFWTKKDPIPTTILNERLIEHWERIAHVKNKYHLDSTNVFGSDDRGLVFMKYGAPSGVFTGKLGVDQYELMRWINDFLLRQEIQRFNTLPEVEIWVYPNIGKGRSTVFMFGKKAGFGKYGLRYGIEELIPDRAFRRNSTLTTRGILPGNMLQLMYYSELHRIDDYFLNRYRELESQWSNARASGLLSPDYDVIRSYLSHYRSMDKARSEFKFLKPDATDALEGLDPLLLKYKYFRYLDKNNEPRISFMVVSNVQSPGELDFTKFYKEAEKSKYKFRHVLVEFDENWNITEKIIDYPSLKNTNTSTFSINHSAAAANYSLTAERFLLDSRLQQIQESDLPDTTKVLGIGSVFTGHIPPLSNNPASFQISDIIVGSDSPEHLNENLLYPFPVIPGDPVRKVVPLKIYLEFYHLQLDENQKARVSLELEIKRLKDKGKVDKKKEKLTQNLKFDFSENNLPKIFEVDISSLAPGDYQFTLKARDAQSKQTRVRIATFRILG